MRFLATILDNPIFIRELRRRLRGRAIIISLIGYVVAMAAISFGIILIEGSFSGKPAQTVGPQIGRHIFMAIAIAQAFLVWLAAPSITSGMTTAERERQTFDFLQATTLSARAFVVGNLLSTLMYILLVLVCALPVMSVAFLYGGIGVGDVATTFGVLLTVAMLLSCFALFASAVHNKTRNIQVAVTGSCVAVGIVMIRTIFSSFAYAGGTPYFQTTVSIFGAKVWLWVVYALCVAFVCFALIVAAGRKLYVADNRLFNYRQYFGFFFVVQLLYAATHWGSSAGSAGNWFFVSSTMLYFAAALFSTGRLEVGDEVWILKRRYPWTRRVDEGLLYMLLLLAVWAGFGALWLVGAGMDAFSILWQGGQALAYLAVSSLLFFYLGRLISQFAYTRRGAFWTLVSTSLTLFVLAPLILFWQMDAFRSGGEEILKRLGAISPFLAHSFLDMSFDANKRDLDFLGFGAACLALMLAVVFVLFLAARRRHKQVNYHFELKA